MSEEEEEEGGGNLMLEPISGLYYSYAGDIFV